MCQHDNVAAQKVWQRVPELEKSTAVAMEKMKLEETARRKLEERLITVSVYMQLFKKVLAGLANACIPMLACLSSPACNLLVLQLT